MSLLCVRVKKAKLSGQNEKYNTYASLKVQNVKSSTICVRGIEPVWEQDYMFEINRIDLHLTIEIWNKGLIWDTLLGSSLVALANVPHTNEEGDGEWFSLYRNVDVKNGVISGNQDMTSHKILCDVRFEFPSELSDREVLILQQKLDQLNELHDESWMVDKSLASFGKHRASSSMSIESDYHSDTSAPVAFQTTQHVNLSASQHGRGIQNRESVFGMRSGSLASNTDESYNPDVGSETESRASDRRLSAEIGSDTEAERQSRRLAAISHGEKLEHLRNETAIALKEQEDEEGDDGSYLGDRTVTPAKYRWIRAFNKVRMQLTGEEMDEDKLNELPSKKTSLWNFGLNNAFFSSIDSMPDIRPRKNSTPLVSDLPPTYAAI